MSSVSDYWLLQSSQRQAAEAPAPSQFRDVSGAVSQDNRLRFSVDAGISGELDNRVGSGASALHAVGAGVITYNGVHRIDQLANSLRDRIKRFPKGRAGVLKQLGEINLYILAAKSPLKKLWPEGPGFRFKEQHTESSIFTLVHIDEGNGGLMRYVRTFEFTPETCVEARCEHIAQFLMPLYGRSIR